MTTLKVQGRQTLIRRRRVRNRAQRGRFGVVATSTGTSHAFGEILHLGTNVLVDAATSSVIGRGLTVGKNLALDHGGWDVHDRRTGSRLTLDSDIDHADTATAAHGTGVGVIRDK